LKPKETISKSENDLIEEVKKYKSAGEFANNKMK
jgi:hypothetical protein